MRMKSFSQPWKWNVCTCVLGKGHVGTARAADVTGADDDSVLLLSWRIEPPRGSPSETTPHWLQLGSEAPHPPTLLGGLYGPLAKPAALAVLDEGEKFWLVRPIGKV